VLMARAATEPPVLRGMRPRHSPWLRRVSCWACLATSISERTLRLAPDSEFALRLPAHLQGAQGRIDALFLGHILSSASPLKAP